MAGYFIFDHLNDGRLAVAPVELVELFQHRDSARRDRVD